MNERSLPARIVLDTSGRVMQRVASILVVLTRPRGARWAPIPPQAVQRSR